MTLDDSQTSLLRALVMLSQANAIIDIFSISQEAELSLFEALRALSRLNDAGLVDQRRLRLTLQGLVSAIRICPEARRHALAVGLLGHSELAVA